MITTLHTSGLFRYAIIYLFTILFLTLSLLLKETKQIAIESEEKL